MATIYMDSHLHKWQDNVLAYIVKSESTVMIVLKSKCQGFGDANWTRDFQA